MGGIHPPLHLMEEDIRLREDKRFAGGHATRAELGFEFGLLNPELVPADVRNVQSCRDLLMSLFEPN